MNSETLSAPLSRSRCFANSGASVFKMIVPTRPKYASVAGCGGAPFSRVHFCANAEVQQISRMMIAKRRMRSNEKELSHLWRRRALRSEERRVGKEGGAPVNRK